MFRLVSVDWQMKSQNFPQNINCSKKELIKTHIALEIDLFEMEKSDCVFKATFTSARCEGVRLHGKMPFPNGWIFFFRHHEMFVCRRDVFDNTEHCSANIHCGLDFPFAHNCIKSFPISVYELAPHHSGWQLDIEAWKYV